MTMTSSIYAPLKIGSVINQDFEVELIDRLAAAVAQAGVQADRIDLANFYVALKHRSMAILTGPAGNGKAAIVECLANLLASSSSDTQRQVVPGHAWYAGGRPANTVLIGVHARMITEKLLCIIEEASLPENAQQVFVVGLTHISPAELLSCFTDVACQMQHNQIMRIGDAHLSAPLPFPPNLLLIGTMDTTDFDWWDEDLLSGATVIDWCADKFIPQSEAASESQSFGREFLRSRLHNSRKAYEKLLSVVAGTKQPLQAIMLVRSVFRTHGFEFPPALLDEVILYLANAWSAQGNGLFDPVTARNLDIASDLALAQLVLPRSLETVQSSETLQAELHSILKENLPRSSTFLKRQYEGYISLIHRKEFETQS
jgi:energy-coupling factor transporter ATP-binding protein EcfA2